MAAEDVTSPTYVLQQRYPTSPVIHHFDFYRLESPTAVWDLGIDELYGEPGFVFIEWADKFPECWPEPSSVTSAKPNSQWWPFP